MDIRDTLYKHYVSTFKGAGAPLTGAQRERYWHWCKLKYMPYLYELDRRSPILDLGSGDGLLMEFLQDQGFEYVEGIDISEEQTKLAQQRGLNVHIGDAVEYLRQHTQYYSGIIAIDFIEHFRKEELSELFDALYSALKPTGLLLMRTPNGSGLFPNQVIYDDLSHMTIFTPTSLSNILQIAHFTRIQFSETGPSTFGFKGRIRLSAWNFIKVMANLVRMIETSKRQTIWTENLICCCRRP